MYQENVFFSWILQDDNIIQWYLQLALCGLSYLNNGTCDHAHIRPQAWEYECNDREDSRNKKLYMQVFDMVPLLTS